MPRNRFQKETGNPAVINTYHYDMSSKTPFLHPAFDSDYTQWLEKHYREKEDIVREMNYLFDSIRESLTEKQIDEFVFMMRQLNPDFKKQLDPDLERQWVFKEIPD